MVKIPRRSKPTFLTAHDVEDNDLATILEIPYVQDADKSRFGKERTVLTVQLKRTGETYRWGLNNTSNDRLVDKFGEDGELWKGKEVKIQKRDENVRGQDRCVLYALPSVQAKIAEDA
jgi:hypothetical protein